MNEQDFMAKLNELNPKPKTIPSFLFFLVIIGITWWLAQFNQVLYVLVVAQFIAVITTFVKVIVIRNNYINLYHNQNYDKIIQKLISRRERLQIPNLNIIFNPFYMLVLRDKLNDFILMLNPEFNLELSELNEEKITRLFTEYHKHTLRILSHIILIVNILVFGLILVVTTSIQNMNISGMKLLWIFIILNTVFVFMFGITYYDQRKERKIVAKFPGNVDDIIYYFEKKQKEIEGKILIDLIEFKIKSETNRKILDILQQYKKNYSDI